MQSGKCPDSTNEKGENWSQKVFALQQSTRIRLTRVLMQARNAICQARVDKMLNIYQEKKQDVGRGREKGGFWKDKLGGDINPAKICYESCTIYEVTRANRPIQVRYT